MIGKMVELVKSFNNMLSADKTKTEDDEDGPGCTTSQNVDEGVIMLSQDCSEIWVPFRALFDLPFDSMAILCAHIQLANVDGGADGVKRTYCRSCDVEYHTRGR